MELKDKLASVDTLIFDDADQLVVINEWSRAQGFDNYAAFIVKVVQDNMNDAQKWAKLKAADALTWAELASKV